MAFGSEFLLMNLGSNDKSVLYAVQNVNPLEANLNFWFMIFGYMIKLDLIQFSEPVPIKEHLLCGLSLLKHRKCMFLIYRLFEKTTEWAAAVASFD